MPIHDETRTFRGLRVLTLESRRGTEMAALIRTFGGQPVEAPALREVPLESNAAALAFAQALIRDEYDFVIFLTGVGVRTLVGAVEHVYPRATFLAALARTKTIVRGPKPLAALRELQVPVWAAAPEPNTWRDVLSAIDAKDATPSLSGARVAVQEYGVSNTALLDELRRLGAHVTPVPVYRWALPENLEPLRNAVRAIARGDVAVALFTTSVQIVHLWQIAEDLHLDSELSRALAQTVIASIGPTTSDELKRRGLMPDVEASHPKIGILVREAAEQSAQLLEGKRTR